MLAHHHQAQHAAAAARGCSSLSSSQLLGPRGSSIIRSRRRGGCTRAACAAAQAHTIQRATSDADFQQVARLRADAYHAVSALQPPGLGGMRQAGGRAWSAHEARAVRSAPQDNRSRFVEGFKRKFVAQEVQPQQPGAAPGMPPLGPCMIMLCAACGCAAIAGGVPEGAHLDARPTGRTAVRMLGEWCACLHCAAARAKAPRTLTCTPARCVTQPRAANNTHADG